MTYAQKKNDPRYLTINLDGNRKLKNNENVRFMIWNLPAVETCPYRTAHCEKSCYARKAERVYPDCLFARKTNFKRSQRSDFVERMIYTIETELETKKFKNKKVVFRIHESGDFYNLEYTEKWVTIARHFENNPNIVFLAYTKSIIYLINCGFGTSVFPLNLVIRSSLWDDTRADLRELTACYNFPIYTALTRLEMDREHDNGHNFTECRCSDCATCEKCWNAAEKDIICEIH